MLQQVSTIFFKKKLSIVIFIISMHAITLILCILQV
jgi:hypothetical protein